MTDKLICLEIKYLLDLLPKIEENKILSLMHYMAQRKYNFYCSKNFNILENKILSY